MTDSPYWNLTDNDFVFAEAGAPWGVERREMGYGLVFQNLPSLSLSLSYSPLKINKVARGMRCFIIISFRMRIIFPSDRYRRKTALRSVSAGQMRLW